MKPNKIAVDLDGENIQEICLKVVELTASYNKEGIFQRTIKTGFSAKKESRCMAVLVAISEYTKQPIPLKPTAEDYEWALSVFDDALNQSIQIKEQAILESGGRL